MSNNNQFSRRRRQQKSQLRTYITATAAFTVAAVALFIVISDLFFSSSSTTASAATINLTSAESYTVSQTATVSSNTYAYTVDGTNESIPKDTIITVKAYYYNSTLGDDDDVTLAEFTLNGASYYIDAQNIELDQDNEINLYIAETLDYSHTEITDDIENVFEQASYKTEDGNPIGVIIHDTGVDGSTIESEVNYMVQSYDVEGVFVHTFVDSDTILRIADEDYKAQGSGANANPYYIQFEMTHESSAKGFAEQLANSAYYTAYMLKKYNLPVTLGQEDGTGTIWTHEMVSLYLGGTDHIDPTEYWTEAAKKYFKTTYDVEDFVELVQAYYNAL